MLHSRSACRAAKEIVGLLGGHTRPLQSSRPDHTWRIPLPLRALICSRTVPGLGFSAVHPPFLACVSLLVRACYQRPKGKFPKPPLRSLNKKIYHKSCQKSRSVLRSQTLSPSALCVENVVPCTVKIGDGVKIRDTFKLKNPPKGILLKWSSLLDEARTYFERNS